MKKRNDFMATKFFPIIFFIIFLFVLFISILQVRGISQEEYCQHHNFTLISECNEWWEFETMNRTTIVFIDNSSVTTLIYNETCNLDDFRDDLEDEFFLFDEDDFRDEVSDIVDDLSIDDEFSWDKYQKDLDHQYRMAQLDANSSHAPVVVEECDYLCQFKRQIETEQEIEMMRLQYCSLNPNLKSCVSDAASVSSPSNTNSSISDAAFSSFKSEIKDLISDSSTPVQGSSFNFSYIIPIILVLAAAFYHYKEFVKQKKAKDYGNYRDEGEMVSKQKLIEEVDKLKEKNKISPFHKGFQK